MDLLVVLLVLLSVIVAVTDGIDPSQCIAPLGMETGAIRDEDIAASSSFDRNNVGPQQGRVRNEINGGAWCPSSPATPDLKEWIEIDFKTVHVITASGTQGRFGNGQGVEFTEAYVLEYWRPSLNKWIRYRSKNSEELQKGNINTYLESKTYLDPPVWASKIKFYPVSHHRRTVCMRVEVYGCRWTDGIVSYSMPQGDKRGNSWEFYDTSYDGSWVGDKLRFGLGQLTDGQIAPDDFKTSFYPGGNSQSWVGWKNDTRENKPIEIVFEFDKVREFTAVNIFANNQFTKDVQVFFEAKVFFSIGGKRYKSEPITYDYIEDHIFETPRNVSIKLHHRLGRFVKLQLQFASKWILLSEVTFDSAVVNGNFTYEEETVDEPEVIKDKTVTRGVDNRKNGVSAVNAPSGVNDYMGIIVAFLSVFVIVITACAIFIMVKQKRCKSSTRPSQIPGGGCEKAALYREPSLVPCNSGDYADVRDCEYAVPLQLPQSSRPPPAFHNFMPKPPPVHGPPPESFYAATEVCNTGFIPPPAPLSTPPPVRLSRQPRYVSNMKTYVGP